MKQNMYSVITVMVYRCLISKTSAKTIKKSGLDALYKDKKTAKKQTSKKNPFSGLVFYTQSAIVALRQG